MADLEAQEPLTGGDGASSGWAHLFVTLSVLIYLFTQLLLATFWLLSCLNADAEQNGLPPVSPWPAVIACLTAALAVGASTPLTAALSCKFKASTMMHQGGALISFVLIFLAILSQLVMMKVASPAMSWWAIFIPVYAVMAVILLFNCALNKNGISY